MKVVEIGINLDFDKIIVNFFNYLPQYIGTEIKEYDFKVQTCILQL